MARATWSTFVVVALCMASCAKLDALGSKCGNGAVDPLTEDCDGDSYAVEFASGRTRPKCGKPGAGPSACRMECGRDSTCPNDNWACRLGVCVNIVDEFCKRDVDAGSTNCTGVLDVIGPAGNVKTVDLDNDGVDVRLSAIRWGTLHDGTLTFLPGCQLLELEATIAMAPSFVGTTEPWIALIDWSAVAFPTTTQLAGRAHVLSPSTVPQEVSIRPQPVLGGYRAIYAEAHDIDGDGDNDFIVLERKYATVETQGSLTRPVLYMNAPCDEKTPDVRCLYVKMIDGFETASGEGLALQRSRIDEKSDPHGHDWWFATIGGDVTQGPGKVVVQRIRVEGSDDKVSFVARSTKSEIPTPQSSAQNQRVTWGDFDGDGVLDLLYVTDRGSRLYRRAEVGQ